MCEWKLDQFIWKEDFKPKIIYDIFSINQYLHIFLNHAELQNWINKRNVALHYQQDMKYKRQSPTCRSRTLGCSQWQPTLTLWLKCLWKLLECLYCIFCEICVVFLAVNIGQQLVCVVVNSMFLSRCNICWCAIENTPKHPTSLSDFFLLIFFSLT